MITCFFVKMNEVVLEVFSFVASRVGGVLVLNRSVGAVEVEFFSFLLRNEGKNEGLLTVSFFDAEALARFRLFSLCFRRNVVCRRSRLLAHGCCRASLCAWPAWYVGRTKGGGLCEGLTRKTLPGATICESDAGRGISVARESAAALSLFAPYPRALLRASPILEIRERVLFAERCESIVHRNVLSRFVLVAKGDLF